MDGKSGRGNKASGSSSELMEQFRLSDNTYDKIRILLELSQLNKDADPNRAWEYAAKAHRMALRVNDKISIASASEALANCLWRLSEYEEGIEKYLEALDTYFECADLNGVARCYCGMGIISGVVEDFYAAMDYFEQALTVAKRDNQHARAATIVGNIGHILFKLKQSEKAIQRFNYALKFFEDNDDKEGIANMLVAIAGVHVYNGKPFDALRMLTRAKDIQMRLNHNRGLVNTLMNIGISLRLMGQYEESKWRLEDSLSKAKAANLHSLEQEILTNLIGVCTELGDEECADKYMKYYLSRQFEEQKQSAKTAGGFSRKLTLLEGIDD